MDNNSIPGTWSERWRAILPFVRLVPQRVHSGFQLGASASCLIRPFLLPDARVNIVNVVGLTGSEFTVLS